MEPEYIHWMEAGLRHSWRDRILSLVPYGGLQGPSTMFRDSQSGWWSLDFQKGQFQY